MAPLPAKKHLTQHFDDAVTAMKHALAHLKSFRHSRAAIMEQELGMCIDMLESNEEFIDLIYEFEKQLTRRNT